MIDFPPTPPHPRPCYGDGVKPQRQIADCTVHVEAFARYLSRNPSWGIFHVVMDDGNFDCDYRGEPATAEERELAAIFDAMTGSQRAKVARLVTRPRSAPPPKP